jgi:hypothetical protein
MSHAERLTIRLTENELEQIYEIFKGISAICELARDDEEHPIAPAELRGLLKPFERNLGEWYVTVNNRDREGGAE